MSNDKPVACVTGASGMVGRAVVKRLMADNRHSVRVLTRSCSYPIEGIEVVTGDINDKEIISGFLANAQSLYHCAAELTDESRMWEVNVSGTECLLKYATVNSIRYLCHISSAGVIGESKSAWVDEGHLCTPRNMYEKSKLAAEQLVSRGFAGCSTVILRPTNVIDDEHPGILAFPRRASFRDRLHAFVKGGECAHIIHAEDVAAAAVFFSDHTFSLPECFFVSCDDDSLNTLAELWSLYAAIRNGKPATTCIRPIFHLPLEVPYFIRRILRGPGNRGDVRYTSEKLMQHGFSFPIGAHGAVERLAKKGIS